VAVCALVVATGACTGEEVAIPEETPNIDTSITTPHLTTPGSMSSTTAGRQSSTIPAPPTTVSPVTAGPTTSVATTTTTTSVPCSSTTVPNRPASIVAFRLPTKQRVVALTFDAGSDLGNTAVILDVLAHYRVRASFGITGEFAEAHPDHIRRMAREGHVVVNHTYSHFSFTGVSSTDVLPDCASRQADLLRADAVLSSLTGASSKPFWRPPFGDYDQSVLDDVGAIGYRYTVLWTVDSLGWRGLAVGEITERVLDLTEPGAIVLMHVGSQSADAQALPAIIEGLAASGYSFTTIEALAA
jgi:peptidoglycan/xylan/chitin deacetylase (PgdA/CDA1 family)